MDHMAPTHTPGIGRHKTELTATSEKNTRRTILYDGANADGSLMLRTLSLENPKKIVAYPEQSKRLALELEVTFN